MKPLSLNRKWLAWHSVYPVKNDESRQKKMARFTFTSTIILANILSIISSVVFFWKFASTDLESALYAVALIIAYSGCLYTVFVTLFMRKKIASIFSSLSQIYDSSEFKLISFVFFFFDFSNISNKYFSVAFVDENTDSFGALVRANDKCHSVCHLFLYYVVPAIAASIVGMGIFSLLFTYYWSGKFNRDLLYVPYNFM